jgi:hypothetical protein
MRVKSGSIGRRVFNNKASLCPSSRHLFPAVLQQYFAEILECISRFPLHDMSSVLI